MWKWPSINVAFVCSDPAAHGQSNEAAFYGAEETYAGEPTLDQLKAVPLKDAKWN